MVTDIQCQVTETWDGTTGLFTVGDGTDPNGFEDYSNVELGSPGYKTPDRGGMGPYLGNFFQLLASPCM